ncbi:MAG: PIN domain-containing protein [Terracidiphilus sp.]|nr:PIN domain-containing protein [Terracidiphilus sp.]
MSAKIFVDTNILVYAHDNREGQKQQVARHILAGLAQDRSGALSMQVLQEFYNTVTRKLEPPLPRKQAREIIEDFAFWCVETTPQEIKHAFWIEDEARIGFWDALIVAAALRSGATRILSEDLSPGQIIAGIRIENPFATP